MAYPYHSQGAPDGHYQYDASGFQQAPQTSQSHVPNTTPTRKRRNRPSGGRNGYHSDTTSAQHSHTLSQHSASQSIDLAAQGGYVAGHAPSQSAYGSVASPRHAVSTPTKPQVYAGPTFLASPAASSLPMPKSFQKHTPTPPVKSTQSSGEWDVGSTRAVRGSPAPGSSLSSGRGGSPLDMLFSADREEKSRKALETASPLSQVQSASQATNGAGRRATPQTGRRPPGSQGQSGKFKMIQEADGSSDQSETEDQAAEPVSFKQRMQAISQSGQGQTKADDEAQQRQNKTQALKDLLLGPGGGDPSTAFDVYGMHGLPQAYGAAAAYPGSPPPAFPQHAHPSQPPRPATSSANPADLKAMEENLRKMLKLGP